MASSDSYIRNIYREITGQEANDSVVNSARAVPDEQLRSFFSGGSSGGGTFGSLSLGAGAGDPADNFIKSVLDDLTRPLKEANDRAKQFDEKNPFVFDEVLAKNSATERLSPYYDSELKDYLSGVDRARGKTLADESKLKKELDIGVDQTTGNIRKNIEETIRNTQEGKASAGLLFSGATERDTGKVAVEGEQNLQDTQRQYDQKASDLGTDTKYRLDELAAGQNTFQRKLNAEKDTSLTTDVEQQRQDALKRHEFERQQVVGYPLTDSTSSLSSIFGLS